MAETFNVSELVVPGVYVRVRAEGLIGVGGISTGNIGVVGTAAQGLGATHILSDIDSARALLGDYDAYAEGAGTLNLMRSVEILYRNGARNVYAHGVAANANQAAFSAAFAELLKDDVNILIAPELTTSAALAVLPSVLETAENAGKDVIAVIGSDTSDVVAISAQVPNNDRVIFSAPGIRAFDRIQTDAETGSAGSTVDLNGRYSAAAVAGLLSSLTPQTSPTNKELSGVTELTRRFSYAEKVQLLNNRVLVLEERGGGARVVRGITSEDGAFRQITTRRITDFAKAGIRKVSDPFIGKLNNARVRAALKGAIDGFLASMVQDESLIAYSLEVTATRNDEINGRALVNVTLQPTFSIDFIAVTMYLQ
jgi:hypothetical protein